MACPQVDRRELRPDGRAAALDYGFMARVADAAAATVRTLAGRPESGDADPGAP